jgi:N-acetylneuraminic acid mutarotase
MLRSGARFNPVTRRWVPMSLENAPSPRQNQQAVWTGTEMIVWGGEGILGSTGRSNPLNTGGRYNPATDSWTPMDTSVLPVGRTGCTMVWTGTEAIIFGGQQYTTNPVGFTLVDSGVRYNPQTEAWAPLSRWQAPSPRYLHVAVWTGTEMLVWGGQYLTNGSSAVLLTTGARYNPTRNTWTPMTTNGAPRSTPYTTAVWNGQEMLVFTGQGPGGRYNPATDHWEPMSKTGAPLANSLTTSVWTGQEMLVWGGLVSVIGARYNPFVDAWTSMVAIDAPKARKSSAAVWTGNSMLVFGGYETTVSALPDTILSYSLTKPLYLYRHP